MHPSDKFEQYFCWVFSYKACVCFYAGVEPLGSEWSSEALLWFQTLVDGEQLSVRVLSSSDQGYDVKLHSRGQDVADALISKQLAKAPGAIPKETYATTGSEETINEIDDSPMHAQASNQAGASPKEMPAEGTAAISEAQLECRCPKDETRWFDDLRSSI